MWFSNITSVHFFLHHQSMIITTDHFISPLLNILCSFHSNPSRDCHTHENTFSQFRNFQLYLLTCSVHTEGKQVHMKHKYRTEYYDKTIMIYWLSLSLGSIRSSTLTRSFHQPTQPTRITDPNYSCSAKEPAAKHGPSRPYKVRKPQTDPSRSPAL